MLAKNRNDNACFLNERGAYEFFASKLAPTKALTDWLACDDVSPANIPSKLCRYPCLSMLLTPRTALQ
ncbi:hypothetical protein CER19_17795 [Pseudomonas sp. GL93]|nr:hypothetical protein CER19_17795 [Pseudomonas sp. GL93]